MPTKAELYAQMADKVATQLTGDPVQTDSIGHSLLFHHSDANARHLPISKNKRLGDS